MTKFKTIISGFVFVGVMLAGSVLAADKTYQAVGKIQKMTGNMLLVRTSSQDIEIMKDAKTKVSGGSLTYGANVTVTYTKPAGNNLATEIKVSAAKR
jgi:hypothetical protein